MIKAKCNSVDRIALPYGIEALEKRSVTVLHCYSVTQLQHKSAAVTVLKHYSATVLQYCIFAEKSVAVLQCCIGTFFTVLKCYSVA